MGANDQGGVGVVGGTAAKRVGGNGIGAVFDSDRAGGGAAARGHGADGDREHHRLAKDRRVGRGGHRGGTGHFIDLLGQDRGGVSDETGVAAIDSGDGVGGDAQGAGGESGLTGAQGARAKGAGAVFEGDAARGGARAGRDRINVGGEGHGLANNGRIGRGRKRGGSTGLVDRLSEHGRGAGVEIIVGIIRSGDRVSADGKRAEGESGLAGTIEELEAQAGGAVKEGNRAAGCAAAWGGGGNGGGKSDRLAKDDRIGGGGDGGGRIGLVDGLGERRGGIVAGVEVAVAAVGGSDGVAAHGERGDGAAGGGAAGQGYRAAKV